MPSFLLFFFTFFQFTINGKIIDAESRSPIAGATIQIKGTDITIKSNLNGEFSLDNLPNNSQVLIITAPNYLSKEVMVDNTESNISIRLSKMNDKEKRAARRKEKQQQKNNPRPKTTIEPDSLEPLDIETVVISTFRADQKTPVTQKTIEKKDIESSYFGQDMPIFLSKTPSIISYADGGNTTGYTYFRLRGIDPTRINMTLNGVPLNESEDQGVYFSNFADFGNSIESIEIQRGVGTSTNGTASFGGSINFESLNLAQNKGGEVHLGYGSFNSYRGSAEYSTGLLKNKLAFYSRFTLSGSDGYREHSGSNSRSFFMSGGYIGDKNMVKLTLFSGFAKNDMAYLATRISDIEQNPKMNYLSPDEKDEFLQNLVQLQYSHSFNNKLNLSASAYHIGITGNYDILAGPEMLNFRLKSMFWGAMANIKYQTQRLHIVGGLHGNLFHRHHQMVIKPQITDFIYHNTGYKNEASAFLKATGNFGLVSIYADVQGRYTDFRYRADSAYNITLDPIRWMFFNPKLGLKVHVNREVNLYASAGITSREPTRTDMLGGYDDIDSSNVGQVGDFSLVKPERVINAELGVNIQYNKVKVQANGYFMSFKNEIAAIGQLNFFGLPLRKNVASSFRTGVELDWKWSILDNLHFSGNLAYCFSRIQEYTTDFDSVSYSNVQPLLTPEWIANAEISYTPFPFWTMAVDARYVGQSFLDNTNNALFVVPHYFLLGFRTSVSFLKHHQIDIMLNNLTNARYYSSGYVDFGSNGPESAYFVQAPFNFFVTYKFKF
ncbi:MAG: TonB-dependent receptor [Aureispira sp.]|nr:TonB-dependent receptor [Aureispira sp.]